jgi:hypothetical protein
MPNQSTWPTREDASIILQLGQGFPIEQYEWFVANFHSKDYADFKEKFPEGSSGRSRVIRLLGFYELAAVLITQGLLNENLFFDIGYGISLVGPRILPIIKGWQKDVDPALWENASWLVQRREAWQEKVWKPNLKWKMKKK